MKRTIPTLACALLVVATVASSAAAQGAQSTAKPASWRHHDLTIRLHNLPERYACDDLQRKFRDVLLALGARQDLKVAPHQCDKRGGRLARSPSVQLQFYLLSPAQARFAEVEAAQRTVRLSPGSPASMVESDCQLLRQIKDELLSETVENIVSFDLACAAPHPGRWPFSVTVQTLTPVRPLAKGFGPALRAPGSQ